MLRVCPLAILLLAATVLGTVACSPEPQTDEAMSVSSESAIEPHIRYVLPGFSSEESARARLVWEAARAMVGAGNANSYSWVTTGTSYSSFNYAPDDTNAWNLIRQSYGYSLLQPPPSTNLPDAYYLSCRTDQNTARSPSYGPCSITYGSLNPLVYGSQAGAFHGGQCKAFTNLVAWRSTVYRGANNTFKTLPTNGDTQATAQNIRAGDILRMPQTHSLIVTKVFVESGITKAVVIDSNFVGVGGNEIIGTHIIDSDPSHAGTTKSISSYLAYQCVYNGTC